MKRLVVIMLAIIAVALSGTEYGDFLLGTYSFLGNKEFVYDNKDNMMAWIDSLSYNVNIMELFQPGTQPDGQIVHSESDFSLILDQMDAQGLQAIIMDRGWEDGSYEHSPYSLSKSNYVKIEAEVHDDMNWYGSSYVKTDETGNDLLTPKHPQDRVGRYRRDLTASNSNEC